MSIYGYQPERALQIVDSGVIVGNMTELQAEQCRARIYCMSLMKERVDSLLGGPTDVCLDSARAIGERILHNDTIKNDLRRRQDVLEILAYTARMKKDTTGWMQWSYELIDVCRQLGGPAETDALRTEAEVGAALHALGRREEGMSKLDHVIEALSEKPDFKFNELDALIIALKRKILLLSSQHDRYVEIPPLARRILERLYMYEKDPDAFHDGIYEIYTLPHTEEDVLTKLTVTALDANDNILKERTFENVPVIRNQVTSYTGSFFGSGGGDSTNDGTFRLTADPDWDAVNGYRF